MAFRNLKPGSAAQAPAPSAAAPVDTAAALRAAAADLAKANPAAAAPAEPVVHETVVVVDDEMANVARNEATHAVTVQPAAGGDLSTMLAKMGIAPASATGTRAVATASESGSALGPYPVLALAGGATGGGFTMLGQAPVPAGLPQGKVPVRGMFLSYRYSALAWEVDFDEAKKLAGSGGAPKPVWSCLIPNTAADDIELVTECARKFQFTAKVNRGKWDFAVSNVGHVKATFEALLYSPDVNGLIVVRSCAGFDSMSRSNASLDKFVDPATNSIRPFPCTVRGVTSNEANKKGDQSWKVHHLEFGGEPTAAGLEIVKAFNTWLGATAADPDQLKAFQDWTTCADDCIDADVRDALRKGKFL